MGKQAWGIVAGLLVIVAAWAFGYYFAGNWTETGSGDIEIVSVAPVMDAQNVEEAQDASADGDDGDPASAASSAASAVGENQPSSPLRYRTYTPDMSGDTTRACLTFSRALDLQEAQYLDYVDVEPEVKLAARAAGKALCLSGFDYNRDYTLTLKSGFPAAQGSGLERDADLTVSFGDKPSVVTFAGDGIILPRIGAQGLAIETVNVETLDVSIFRVTDRIVARRSPQSGEVTEEGGYSWEYNNAGTDVRETIWEGQVDVKSDPNQTVTTVLPIRDFIGELKAGAYIVKASRFSDDSAARTAKAWRWIISTDLAMTSYEGADGLAITVRSIDTAKAMPNTKVTLVAKNNDLLAEGVTNKDGHIKFPKAMLRGDGPAKAQMVMAYGEAGDYAILDLRRSPLDLSDRNIDGRLGSSAVDVYAYTDRGVYRPGETAHITMMLRDELGRALDRVGTLSLRKPSGMEANSVRITDLNAGTFVHDFNIPTSAPRGVWQAVLDVDGFGRAGTATFTVEDFIPQKITVDLTSSSEILTPASTSVLTVRSDFLYGAPGKDLEAEADMRIRVDPAPFPDFKTYTFGVANDPFREESFTLGSKLTDAKGTADFEITQPNSGMNTFSPLRAEITAGVAEPGGRYIQNSIRLPVRTRDIYVGLDPQFEDNRSARNAVAGFNVIALDSSGKRIASPDAGWELVRERWDYHWYRQNGRWRYRRDTRDEPMTTGRVDISETAPATVGERLDWGNYRLIITTKTGEWASYRFSVGWGGSDITDTPDKLSLTAPSAPTKVGNSVTLALNAPYGGLGELVIASDRVHTVRNIKIPKGGTELSIPVKAEWGAGAYAMLTLYTPRDVSSRPVPRRAVGIAYMPVNTDDKTLAVTIKAPDVVRPRKTQTVELALSGALAETNYVTLAAIDEGILRITKYKSPSPEDFYFGKRALGVELRDDYARLLNPNLGEPTLARSGGDGLGGEGLTSVPVRIVSLFSGPVSLKNGKAKINFDLPDFNGEVRLMAVAWNDKAVGSASQAMKVRDPVPADLTLPRFLAPGDTAYGVVTLDNVEGKAGAYRSAIRLAKNSGDILSLANSKQTASLAVGERKSENVALTASQTGTTHIDLNVEGPGRYAAVMNYAFEVRSPFRPVTRVTRTRLSKGEAARLSQSYIDGLDPASVDVNISFARGPNLDPSAYAASLARYPYGCTEQTASSGMPLLYAKDIGGIPGFNTDYANKEMQAAVDKLLGRLSQDGAFGLWSEGDGYATAWVGAYAAEFIQRASESGFDVPKSSMKTVYKGLREVAKMENYPSIEYDYGRNYSRWQSGYRGQRSAEAAAYAFYVLARGQDGDLSKMRYFYDNHSDVLKTPLSFGHIGAALSMMGDKVRSREAFERAAKALGYEDDRDYYQSPLRDTAGLIALMDEIGRTDGEQVFIDQFDKDLKEPNRLHTQEKVRVVLAIRAMMADKGRLNIEGQNIDLSEANRAHLYAADLSTNPVLTNRGDDSALMTVSVTGTPTVAPEAFSDGIIMTKSIKSVSGEGIDLAKVARGDRMIVSLEFNSEINRERQIVIADLLPAGVEIETILRPADGKASRENDDTDGLYSWLGQISNFDVTEARDDRFIASLKTDRKESYRAAYIVRAVTAGDFIVPGASIEDMYRPDAQAVTEAGRMTIIATPQG